MKTLQAGLGVAVCVCVTVAAAGRPAHASPPIETSYATSYITLRPVEPPFGMGRPLADFTLSGNQLTVPAGGVRLWFEIKLGGWSPELLRTWQATIAPASYSNGVGADLLPAVEPCNTSTECELFLGHGSTCSEGFCTPGWQNQAREDFVIRGGISAVRTTSLEYTYGSTIGIVPPSDQPVADDGLPHYGGTLVIDVPPDASGRYELHLRMGGATFMVDENGSEIPSVALSMVVVLPTFCCYPDGTCAEAPLGCAAGGGQSVSSCLGDCDGNGSDDRCDLLSNAEDCNGNDVLDACDVPWDANGDGLVTTVDYGRLFSCLIPCGPGPCDPGYVATQTAACCHLADVDGDGDSDLRDYAELEVIMSTQTP